jgi:hypothetical protein
MRLSAHFYTEARTIGRGRTLPDGATPAVVHRRPRSATSGARRRLRSERRRQEHPFWAETRFASHMQGGLAKRND